MAKRSPTTKKPAAKPVKKLAKKPAPAKKAAPKKAAPKKAAPKKAAPKKAASKPAPKPAPAAKPPATKVAEKLAPAKPTVKRAKTRFSVGIVMKLVELARSGNAHAILGISPNLPIREALSEPPPWTKKSYDLLLALYLGNDTFGHADWTGYIYDFAEHTFFKNDDEGYLLAQLNSDLGAIHASRDFGVFDEPRAVDYFRAALAGPRPEDVVRDLDQVIAASPTPLPLLAKLAKNPQPED